MEYKIFLTDSIEMLKNEQLIGEANSYKEACKNIQQYIAESDLPKEPYWRFLSHETVTIIDFGSWSKFAAIVPPISVKELMGEE